MKPGNLPELDALVRASIVDAGVAPGGTVAVRLVQDALGPPAPAPTGEPLGARGAAGTHSSRSPVRVTAETPFDLASVTKPIVACTLVRLARAGVLRLEDPLASYAPELEGTPSGTVSLEMLLSHRAGLEAHVAVHAIVEPSRPLDAALALRIAAGARRPDAQGPPPEGGFPPLYSDLGYILAGVAASRAAGRELSLLVDQEVLLPLGLEEELGSAVALRARRPHFDRDVAPTEVVESRGGEVRGAVHDENAWALTGHGLSGHAGLFGTADGVARFGASILEALLGRRPGWLTAEEAAFLVRERPGGTLRAGFDGRSVEGSSAGAEFGPRSFGHLGFTGTSLWCDPDAGVAAALLTNRVNPSRDNLAIRAARPAVHDALHRAAGAGPG